MNTIKNSLILSSVFFCLFSYLFASNPYLEKALYTVRDPSTDRKLFRSSMKKVGEYLALDISKDMSTKSARVTTVMKTEAMHQIIDEEIVILTILRAGLPFLDGFLEVFPDAEVGFFAMNRDEITLESTVYYEAIPKLEGKTVIIADPMIATGGSMFHALEYVESNMPKKIIVAGAFAVEEGMAKLQKHNPNIKLYTGVVDPVLTKIGYISPGLGDAGDRAFGTKVELK